MTHSKLTHADGTTLRSKPHFRLRPTLVELSDSPRDCMCWGTVALTVAGLYALVSSPIWVEIGIAWAAARTPELLTVLFGG